MLIPMRHARFASLRERIRSTCVETSGAYDEKRIARLFGLTLGVPFAVSLILSAITI
jgi:pyruvate-formate lyase-activating enzyme